MKVFIVVALIAVASAAEVYPTAKYQPAPAYQPAYKTYEYAPQPYSFQYAVKDEYYNDYSHQESSDGKAVSGSYRVALPDGRIQTVTYSDNGYGLVADVKYEGQAKYAEYKPAYKPAVYEAPKYAAYQPAPVAYQPAPVAYKPAPVVYEAPKYVAVQPVYKPAYKAPAPVAYTTAAPYTTTEYATTVAY